MHYGNTNCCRKIYSVSADKSAMIWDPIRHKRLRRYKDHEAIINSCSSTATLKQSLVDVSKTETLFVTGSDDRTAKLFDTRSKDCVTSLACKYPVLSVAMSENEIFTAGIDEVIKVWDMRKNTMLYTMKGHTDAITGIRLSPDGNSLLSAAMDGSLNIWDVRPFLPTGSDTSRLSKQIQGAVVYGMDKNLLRCAWSSNGTKISCGSADIPTHVYIWDSRTTRLLYRLPGHKGAVNDVDFHPFEPIIASASSDRTIYLGEIEP
jgi:Prp8 binding protein